MPLVSANWLSRHTGKDWRTVKKRIDKLPGTKNGKVDSIIALEAIYCGQITNGNGEFISTPEAVRQLTIAKKAEIDVELEIKRGERIPRADVDAACRMVFRQVCSILKANRNKVLSEAQINEIFSQFRDVSKQFKNEYSDNESTPADHP